MRDDFIFIDIAVELRLVEALTALAVVLDITGPEDLEP
jgi:hypothetical protein